MAFVLDPVSIAAGLGIGLIAGALVARTAGTKAQARLGHLEEQKAELQATIEKLSGEAVSLREAKSQLEARNATLMEQVRGEQERGAERQKAFDEARKTMTDTFEALAGKALEGSTEKLMRTAEERFKRLQEASGGELEKRQEAIAQLVKPVHDNLAQMREQLTQLEKEREGAYQSLRQQVSSMGEQHQILREETLKLNNALRNAKQRGNWGELQLRNVVEMAGMLAHVDFDEQTTMENDEGRLQRPDMVVKLPGGQRIAVDAKVPLDAFLRAADNPEQAARFHKEHADAVAKHVKELGSKAYWKKLDYSPEFVVLFMPGEHYFSVALDHRPGLIQEGMDSHVIIATPTTLLALLRAVHFGWRQESLAESARQIAEQGKVLYDRLGTMAGHVNKVGKALTGAVSSYNDFVGSLDSRVLPAARKMGELQALTAPDSADPGLALNPVETSTRALQAPEFAEDQG
jgi:DNA recombination protein RmuC